METISDLLMVAIFENDHYLVNYCLQQGTPVNKIYKNGMTHLGVAAQIGNLQILQALLKSCRGSLQETKIDKSALKLDLSGNKRNNLGYYVVCRECEDNDFGEGPTPDGMEALEWDMEVNDNTKEESSPTDPEGNLYKWYAKILNETSIILKSPDNDIARLDRHGQNILHHAIISGNTEVVKYLLDNFAEIGVDQCNAGWYSPLHLAVVHGSKAIVKVLLEHNANVNCASCDRRTPLHIAAERGFCEIMSLLIASGANLNAYDVEERSPLMVAVLGSKEDAAGLLIRNGASLNHEDITGYTVLYMAVSNGLASTTKLLLEMGAKIIQSHYLLHLAIRVGNFDIVKILVKYRMFLNQRNEIGLTPLMTACSSGNVRVASYLLDHGASANTLNHINYMSALHFCVRDVTEPIALKQLIELLIEHDVDLNTVSHQGNVLFFSIIQGNVHAAAMLVKHGVDVNFREERAYYDNLSLARKCGDPDLVRLIVYAGFKMDNLLVDYRELRINMLDPIDGFLALAMSRPLNLKELARIAVRKALGKQLMKKVELLPLPKVLKTYLRMEIV